MKTNCEKGGGVTMAKMNKVTSYPTIITYTKKGKEVARRVGAIYNPEEAIKYFKDILKNKHTSTETKGEK